MIWVDNTTELVIQEVFGGNGEYWKNDQLFHDDCANSHKVKVQTEPQRKPPRTDRATISSTSPSDNKIISRSLLKTQNYRHSNSKKGSLNTRNLSKVKKADCLICKKVFQCKAALAIHLLIHTGEKPFECEVCSKRFKQKGQLKVHSRTHVSEKTCAKCSKTFVKKNLSSHFCS